VFPKRAARCPYCHAPQPPMVEGEAAACMYCGSVFSVSEGICPRCGTANLEDAEVCRECGEPLSMIGRVFQRHQDARRPPQFLEYARQQAPNIKRTEAEASRRRSDAFHAQEARRIDRLHFQRAEQAAKDRRLLVIGLTALGSLVLILLSVAAVHWLYP